MTEQERIEQLEGQLAKALAQSARLQEIADNAIAGWERALNRQDAARAELLACLTPPDPLAIKAFSEAVADTSSQLAQAHFLDGVAPVEVAS